MTFSKKNNKGTTLVELLVYMAMIALITGTVVSGILQLSGVFVKSRMERKVALAASTSLERVTRELRLARNIVSISESPNPPAIVLDSYKEYLTEDFLDPSNKTNKTITLSGSELIIDDGSGSVSLTPFDVRVSNVSFVELENLIGVYLARSKAVRFEATFSAGEGKNLVTHTYGTTVTVQGNYGF